MEKDNIVPGEAKQRGSKSEGQGRGGMCWWGNPALNDVAKDEHLERLSDAAEELLLNTSRDCRAKVTCKFVYT